MSFLTNSDIAAVSDHKAIHVFYESTEGEINEVISQDGKSWTKGSTLAKGELSPNGSPLTAFYCEKDLTNGGKPSIHVFYLNTNKELCEQVRAVAENTWKKMKFPTNIVKPIDTTKLACGVCHDGPTSSESHHWLYFSNEDDKGKQQIAELRKGGANDWKNWKVMPQEYGSALPGTAIGCSMTNPTIFLQLQSHDLDIYQCEGGYETWSKSELVVQGSDTIARTPLASVIDGDGKSHFFFAGKIDGSIWVQSDFGGKRAKIGIWTGGSYIGAVLHGGKQYVFMDEAFHATAISTYVHEGSSWTDLGQINAH